jgi:hypothetical protein
MCDGLILHRLAGLRNGTPNGKRAMSLGLLELGSMCFYSLPYTVSIS